jgi:hypothetical protein
VLLLECTPLLPIRGLIAFEPGMNRRRLDINVNDNLILELLMWACLLALRQMTTNLGKLLQTSNNIGVHIDRVRHVVDWASS